MIRKFWLALILLLGAGLLMQGCSAPASPSQPQGTVEAMVTAASEATPTMDATLQSVEIEPTQAPLVQDTCVACHSDRQRITDLAKPEEDTEGESKGVG